MPIDLTTAALYVTTIGGCLTIFGVPFMIYTVYIRNQKKDNDKITDTEKSDINLAAEVKLLRTEFSLKIQGLTDAFMLIKSNDLHEIHEKMRDHDDELNKFRVTVEKLTTIIDERVPRKTVDQVS